MASSSSSSSSSSEPTSPTNAASAGLGTAAASPEVVVFYCGVVGVNCKEQFTSQRERSKHESKAHKQFLRERAVEKKSFDDQLALKKQQEGGAAAAAAAASSKSKKRAGKPKSDEVFPLFKCAISRHQACRCVFSCKSTRNRHETDEETPCTVPGCHSVLKSKRALDAHIKSKHEGLGFACPVPGCNYVKDRQSRVQNHILKRHPGVSIVDLILGTSSSSSPSPSSDKSSTSSSPPPQDMGSPAQGPAPVSSPEIPMPSEIDGLLLLLQDFCQDEGGLSRSAENALYLLDQVGNRLDSLTSGSFHLDGLTTLWSNHVVEAMVKICPLLSEHHRDHVSQVLNRLIHRPHFFTSNDDSCLAALTIVTILVKSNCAQQLNYERHRNTFIGSAFRRVSLDARSGKMIPQMYLASYLMKHASQLASTREVFGDLSAEPELERFYTVVVDKIMSQIDVDDAASHPVQTLVMVSRFIPLAEKHNLIDIKDRLELHQTHAKTLLKDYHDDFRTQLLHLASQVAPSVSSPLEFYQTLLPQGTILQVVGDAWNPTIPIIGNVMGWIPVGQALIDNSKYELLDVFCHHLEQHWSIHQSTDMVALASIWFLRAEKGRMVRYLQIVDGNNEAMAGFDMVDPEAVSLLYHGGLHTLGLLNDDPATKVRASLYLGIGRLLMEEGGMSNLESAVRWQEDAYRLRYAKLGEAHPLTMQAWYAGAEILHKKAKTNTDPEANANDLRKALEILRAVEIQWAKAGKTAYVATLRETRAEILQTYSTLITDPVIRKAFLNEAITNISKCCDTRKEVFGTAHKRYLRAVALKGRLKAIQDGFDE